MSASAKEIQSLRYALSYSWNRRPSLQDIWRVDPPYYLSGEDGSHDHFFRGFLREEGVETFEELLAQRRAYGRSTHLLEVFGSAWFIDDVTLADSITGIRMRNTTDVLLHELIKKRPWVQNNEELMRLNIAVDRIQRFRQAPHWKVETGNVYKPKTWMSLDSGMTERGVPYIDVAVIKPEGAVENKLVLQIEDWYDWSDPVQFRYGWIFLRLLNRVYRRVTPNNGIIITEVPPCLSEGEYLNKFCERAVSHGNISVSIADSFFYEDRKNLKLIKQWNSVPDLESLVLENRLM